MILKGITALSAILAVISAIFGHIWMLPVYFVGYFIACFVAALAFLLIVCGVVDVEKPQEQDSKFYRVLAKYYVELIITVARVHIDIQGMEKLPKEGRFVLVCNHLNDVDPGILIHCFAQSQLVFISKRENKHMPVVGQVMHKLQCQLINRENDREALKTILKCIQILKEDRGSVMVFPEGYVSLDGRLRHFRSGVFKIAQKADVPIVVCTLKDTKTVLPNLKKLQPSRVQLHLVDVISAEDVKAVSTMELAEQVYEMMIADLGEEVRCDEKAMHPDLQRKRMEQ